VDFLVEDLLKIKTADHSKIQLELSDILMISVIIPEPKRSLDEE